MSATTVVTRFPNGTNKHTVTAGEIEVPDLWHVAQRLDQLAKQHDDVGLKVAAQRALECWHLAHDLKKHIIDKED